MPAEAPSIVVAGTDRPSTLRQARAAGTATGPASSRFVIPTRGVRIPNHLPPLDARCHAILLVAPVGSAISHRTAALLHGLWLPRRYEPGEPVHVTRPAGSSRIRRAGYVDHDSARGIRGHDLIRGIRVVAAVDTWADLAGQLSVPDLVALGDALANRQDGIAALADTLSTRVFHGCRHTRRMQEALALVRPGSASYMESRARVSFVMAGLPEPELNADVADDHGEWLARVDFLWRHARLVVEYQSEVHHGDPRAREADERRRRLLEASGFRVVFITASTVFDESQADELAQEICARLADAAPRPPSPRAVSSSGASPASRQFK